MICRRALNQTLDYSQTILLYTEVYRMPTMHIYSRGTCRVWKSGRTNGSWSSTLGNLSHQVAQPTVYGILSVPSTAWGSLQQRILRGKLSQDFSWNKHISQFASKTNKTLGFVRRNLQISSPTIKEQAYYSLVRPLTEYSSSVWDPYTHKNVYQLEMVQRRAARWTLHRFHNTSSVTDMLTHLNWPTLQRCRTEASLCMLYKMVHKVVAVDVG